MLLHEQIAYPDQILYYISVYYDLKYWAMAPSIVYDGSPNGCI